MTIRVKLFAILKEKIGAEEMTFECPPNASCENVAEYFKSEFPGLRLVLDRSMFVVNGQDAQHATTLSGGDELAFLPPLSGG